MAEIISDVTKDIQRLKELKVAIEDVKKSLKTINVDINKDGVKVLEEHLKALTTDYKALIDKVAEAEGKVMISTKKIVDAVKALAEYENKAKQAVGQFDLSSSTKLLAKFDGEVLKMCTNLNKYFDGLLVKADSMSSLLEAGKTDVSKLFRNSDISGIKDLEVRNAALMKELDKQREGIRQQQAEWAKLEETIKATTQATATDDGEAAAPVQQFTGTPAGIMATREQITMVSTGDVPDAALFRQAGQEAEYMYKQMSLVNAEMEYLASPERNLTALKAVLSGVASATGLVADVMELVNVKNEDMAQIQAKVQSLLNVTVHLEEAYNMVKKSSVLMLVVEDVQRRAAVASLGLESKAKATNVALTWGEVAAQKAFNLVANANPYVLLATAILTVVGGIALLIKANKESTQDASVTAQKQKEQLEEEQRLRKSAAESVTSQLAEYKRLQVEYKALNGSVDKQKKFIADNQSEFQKLGVSVKDVNEAENLFVKNEQAFVSSLQHRALAAAGMARMQEQYKIIIGKMIEKDDYIKNQGDSGTRNAALTTAVDEIKSMLVRQGIAKTPEGAQAYIPEIIAAYDEKRSNKNVLLKGTGIQEAFGRIYNQYVNQFAEWEAMQLFDNSKEVQGANKVIGQTANIVKNERKAADNSLQKGNITKSGAESNNKPNKPNKPDKVDEDKKLEWQEKLAEELLALKRKNQQDEINLMQDGMEKKLEQIDLDFKKENDVIDKQKKEWEKQQGGKLFDGQTAIIEKRIENAVATKEAKTAGVKKEQLEAETRAMHEYNKEYGDIMQKRDAIKALGKEKKKGKNEWEQKLIDAETTKELSALDEEANKTTSAISALFNKMKDSTLTDLKAIGEKGKEALDFLNGGKWDEQKGKELGMTKENFEVWSNDPEKIESITNALEENQEAAEQLKPCYEKVGDGIKGLFEAGDNPEKLQKSLAEIEAGLNQIMGVGQFLSDTFSNLGEAFGNDTFKGIAEGINVAMDAASSAMEGAKAGAMFGPIGAAAGAALGLVSSLASSIAKIHDAKHEKRILLIQEQIEVLEKSYEKLGDSVEEAYSKDASNLIGQQNEMLEQQKVLIQNQIKEEQSKKNADGNRIKEWQEQLEDIDKVIAENKEKAVDAIFGEDLKSAIDNFAEAYANAWTSGEDKAKSAKDVVKNMMRQMVTESIKAAIQSSESMEKIRAKLQEFYADNVLDDWEQNYIYGMATDLQKELDQKYGWADNLMKDEDESTREASEKGIATASQESVDENNGRLAVMQEYTYAINENVSHMVTGIDSIAHYSANLSSLANIDRATQSILTMRDAALSHLTNIDNNTARLATIESTLASMKNGIDTLNIKGITIKK